VQLESLNQTSHLGNPLPTPREGHRGLRLLLVRHGETEWNRVSRFQGGIDVPLNDNGRRQAQMAAEFLKDVPIDFAISSPMLRPKETAEIILTVSPKCQTGTARGPLKEINHGLWEGKLESEIKQEYPDLLRQWQVAPETVQMPEGKISSRCGIGQLLVGMRSPNLLRCLTLNSKRVLLLLTMPSIR
jgi:broad specificity phosphatase PhoE